MGYVWLILVFVSSQYFLGNEEVVAAQKNKVTQQVHAQQTNPLIDDIEAITKMVLKHALISKISLEDINSMLLKHNDTLSHDVIHVVSKTIQCVQGSGKKLNSILTIIDYSLPSNKKRLWIFNMKTKKLLYYTYVSHAIRSGTLDSRYFSNKVNSKSSSLGVYHTENSYTGRHGISLKLQGLDHGFNHNAYRRYVVMHGAWYVNEGFIKKYGRIGRSWGCPAVPNSLDSQIINTIKNKSLFVIYYPSNRWLVKSRYLNCNKSSPIQLVKNIQTIPDKALFDHRGHILYADRNNNNKREEHEPVMVVTAANYERIFQSKSPLKRMLRRQIDHAEYIVLNPDDLKRMDTNNDNMIDNADNDYLGEVKFVIPVVRRVKGYYKTEFRAVNMGTLKQIRMNDGKPVLSTSKKNVNIRSTNRFIRWLGL